MIPLRFLHLTPGDDGPDHRLAEVLITALAARGHHGALLVPGAATSTGPDRVTFTPGWWRWWRHGRQEAVGAVAAWSPDLIHVHGLAHLGNALDLARRLGLPVVVTLSRCEDPYTARRLRDPLVRLVLVPSERHRSHVHSVVGVPRDRIAPLPPPMPSFPPHRHEEEGTAWTAATLFGRERWRNDRRALRRWLSAIAGIQSAGLPVGALVACDDQDLAEIIRGEARHCGAQVGTCAEHDVLRRTDVLCLVGPREAPVDLVLLAQAVGVPLIATAVGGIPELVRDGETAVLVEQGSTHELGEALRGLHDHHRRRSLAEAAQSLSRERYDAALVAEAVESMYRGVLGSTATSTVSDVTRSWRRMTAHRH